MIRCLVGSEMATVPSGLNFINVLCTAFAPADPESVKNQFRQQYIFTLLGSECIKAEPRTFMKLTPGDPAAF